MKLNPLTQIDFYKADHRRQYPDNTEYVLTNGTPRSDRIYRKEATPFYNGKVVNWGLQGFITWFFEDLWNQEFFNKDKGTVISNYKRRMDTSLGEGAIPMDHIEALHDLGYLPIEIKSLPEGTLVPYKTPLFTVENTHPDFFWLVNYVETVISNAIWKPITIATIAKEYKDIMEYYYELTGAFEGLLPFSCHDFSARGMSLPYDASLSSTGHLLSFAGTDTVSAIDYVEEYYSANPYEELIGASVPATEHSVMCMGTKESEIETFRRLITNLYPSGIVSIVSDTWDFWKVITNYAVELKDEILNRTPNNIGLAKVVFRPDSGDPIKVITGYRHIIKEYNSWDEVVEDSPFELCDVEAINVKGVWYPCGWTSEDDFEYDLLNPLTEAEVKGAVECLWDVFGGTETDKGYKTLNQRVGLIYGDSITRKRAVEILQRLADKGFSADNIVFGVGSYSYQYNTRDTIGFAMKATVGKVDGETREIFKDPITDSGVKKSAKGFLFVNDNLELEDQVSEEKFNSKENNLKTIWKNGVFVREESFSTIKRRLENQ